MTEQQKKDKVSYCIKVHGEGYYVSQYCYDNELFPVFEKHINNKVKFYKNFDRALTFAKKFNLNFIGFCDITDVSICDNAGNEVYCLKREQI